MISHYCTARDVPAAGNRSTSINAILLRTILLLHLRRSHFVLEGNQESQRSSRTVVASSHRSSVPVDQIDANYGFQSGSSNTVGQSHFSKQWIINRMSVLVLAKGDNGLRDLTNISSSGHHRGVRRGLQVQAISKVMHKKYKDCSSN